MKKFLLLALMCLIFGTEGTGQNIRAYKDGSQYGFKDKDGDIVIQPKYEDARSFTANTAAVKLNGKWGIINLNDKEIIPFKYEDAYNFYKGLAPVKLNGKWGFIDKTDKEIIPFRYDIARNFSEGLAHVKLNGKWGFIDETDKEIIPFKYEDAFIFTEGLAHVKLNGKWGIIDKTGKEIIPFKYEGGAFLFSGGLAKVKKDGKWGYIDKTGHEITSAIYEELYDFKDGLAKVKKDGKWGYIDKTGAEVISPIYEEINPFKDGLAKVKKNGTWGVIDKAGNVIIKSKYSEVGDFLDNVAIVKEPYPDWWGTVDITGKEIIPVVYTKSKFNKELKDKYYKDKVAKNKAKGKYDAVLAKIKQAEMKYPAEPKPNIANEEDVHGEPKVYWFAKISIYRVGFHGSDVTDILYGLKSMDGTVILPAIYEMRSEFDNCGMAWLYERMRREHLIINTKGETVITVKDFSGFYSNCIAYIRKSDNEWSIVDNTGKEALSLRYDNLIMPDPYKNTALPTDSINYITTVKDGKYGAINGKGEEILPAIYDEIKPSGEYFLAKKDRNHEIFDSKGRHAYQGEYEDVSFCCGGTEFFIAKKDGKYGVVNKEQKVYIPFKYAAIGRFDDMLGPFPVKLTSDGKWGYIDRNTKVVLPFQYDEAGGFFGNPRIATVKNEYAYTIDTKGQKAGLSREEKDNINNYIKIETQDIFFAKGDGLSFWDHLSSANTDLKNWNVFVVAKVKNTGKLPKRIKAIPKLIITNKHTVSVLFMSETSTDYKTYNAEWYIDIAPNSSNVVIGYFKFQQQSGFHGGAIFGMGTNSYIDENNAFRISFEYYDNKIPASVIQQQNDLIETLRKNGNVAIKEGYASQYREAQSARYASGSEKKDEKETKAQSSNDAICNNYNKTDVDVPEATGGAWKAAAPGSPTDIRDITFKDGTKGRLFRWNKTNEAAKEYNVPYIEDEVGVKWHYKTDEDAIKALYFYKKCKKKRAVGHYNP
jgi:hypothetical protein